MNTGSLGLTLDDVAALLDQSATTEEHCRRFAAPILEKFGAQLVAVARGPRNDLRLEYAIGPYGELSAGTKIGEALMLDRLYAGETAVLHEGEAWPPAWPVAIAGAAPPEGAAILTPLVGEGGTAGFALVAGVPLDFEPDHIRALRSAARVLALALTQPSLRDEYDRLTKASNVDSLTGLLNRSAFYERLRIEFRRASRDVTALALALLDVDYFAPYADAYGRESADRVLRAVAQTIASAGLRSSDFVSRYSGAALAMVMPGSESDGALALCDRIRQTVASCAIEHTRSPYGIVTVSIGVASMRPNARRVPASLIYDAESAVRRAKQAGRNRVASKDEIRTSPAGSPRSLLPLLPESPFWREAELARLTTLGAPLLTLVGPPKSGKSRFAIELAHRAVERAIYVDLSNADDASVVSLVGAALHVAADARAELVAALRDRAGGEPLLLVLDGCNDCRDGVTDFIIAIAGISGVRTVVTADSPLALRGEHAYALEALR